MELNKKWIDVTRAEMAAHFDMEEQDLTFDDIEALEAFNDIARNRENYE